MSDSVGFGNSAAVARDRAHTLFAHTMWYVALTAGVFALAAYAGRHQARGLAIVWFIVALACLFAMHFAAQRSRGLTTALLLAVGAAMGLAMAPTINYYADASPQALWQAGGATALFVAAFGAAGYATRRDLAWLGRISFFALIALILAGIVLIFIQIPGAALLYSVLGLLVFAGLTMYDFQRLRRSTDLRSAPLLAGSIFVDALNIFMFFLRIMSRGD